MTEETPIHDPPLTSEEQAIVEQLSEGDIEEIDRALLSNISHHWQKVAMVVGMTMMNYSNWVPGVPDLFYGLRVRNLIESGRIEAQGDMACMRFSEVRLPAANAT